MFIINECHLGFWRIKKIQEKKERHIWANQVMNELVDLTSLYKYRNTGQNPQETKTSKDKEEAYNAIMLDEASPLPSDHAARNSTDTHIEAITFSSSQYNYKPRSDQNEPGELTVLLPFFCLHCMLH